MGAPLAVADERTLRELDDVRQRLDDLDRQLLGILARRFEAGSEAVRLKAQLGMAMHMYAMENKGLFPAGSRFDNVVREDWIYYQTNGTANNRGTAVKKREDTHRMAEANRAFAHNRW